MRKCSLLPFELSSTRSCGLCTQLDALFCGVIILPLKVVMHNAICQEFGVYITALFSEFERSSVFFSSEHGVFCGEICVSGCVVSVGA